MVSVLTLKTLVVVLLVGSAALFAVGVAIERSQPAHSAAREASERAAAGTTTAEAHGEGTAKEGTDEGAAAPAAGESPSERAGEGSAAPVESTGATTAGASEARSERIFGLNPDATGLVIAALVASALMAIAVWRYPALVPLLIVVALASLSFAVFDVREAFHQSSESRTGLVVVAALVAGLHLGAAAVGAAMAAYPRGDDRRPSPRVA